MGGSAPDRGMKPRSHNARFEAPPLHALSLLSSVPPHDLACRLPLITFSNSFDCAVHGQLDCSFHCPAQYIALNNPPIVTAPTGLKADCARSHSEIKTSLLNSLLRELKLGSPTQPRCLLWVDHSMQLNVDCALDHRTKGLLARTKTQGTTSVTSKE